MSITHGERESAVRRVLLAVTVLDGVDVQPTDAGILLGLQPRPDRPGRTLSWESAVEVVGDLPASSPAARVRLRSWLRQHALLAGSGPRAVLDGLRPLALAPTSALHPGPGWRRSRVLGGVLELGFGVLRAPSTGPALRVLDELGETVVLCEPLWPDVAALAGLAGPGRHAQLVPAAPGSGSPTVDGAWTRALDRLETLGDVAGRRARRRDDQVLDAAGGLDVPTLLCSASLRSHLVARAGGGLCAVAVPARARAWTCEARIDPAFVAAAWSATDVDEQGLDVPLLVTADEVGAAVRLAG